MATKDKFFTVRDDKDSKIAEQFDKIKLYWEQQNGGKVITNKVLLLLILRTYNKRLERDKPPASQMFNF